MPRKSLSSTDIDLFREGFCEAAYAIYVRDGYAAVTMRGIARHLGSSPMMAYRYFENKDDVINSLRALRFHDLARVLEEVPSGSSPEVYLRDLGVAYAGFAHEEPHAYRLLYTTELHQLETNQEVVEAQGRTKNVLFEATRRLIATGLVQGDPVLIAHTFWASIHGLVSLDLDNQLSQGASFDQLFPAMLEYLINPGGSHS